MVEIDEVSSRFGLDLVAPWADGLLTTLNDACTDLVGALGGIAPLWMHGLKIRLVEMPQLGLTSAGLVRLNSKTITSWTTVHELGHAWDLSNGGRLSRRMQWVTHSTGILSPLKTLYPQDPRFWYHVGSPPPPCGSDVNFNRLEDFAESVAAYVYPDKAKQKAQERNYPYEAYGYNTFFETPRGRFIHDLIESV